MFRVTRQCDWRREEHRGSRSNGVGGDAAERVAVPDSCQGFRGPVLQNHDLREESKRSRLSLLHSMHLRRTGDPSRTAALTSQLGAAFLP